MSGSIWTDKRLWIALALALVFRTVLGRSLSVVLDEPEPPPLEDPALAPTRPPEPESGPAADLRRVVQEQQIRKINLRDGSSAEPPMGPAAAAGWFGGFVLFLGGFGTVWLWRRAERAEREGDNFQPD